MKQKLVAKNFNQQPNQKKDLTLLEQKNHKRSKKKDLKQKRKTSTMLNNKPRPQNNKKKSRLSNDDNTPEESKIDKRKIFLVGTVCLVVAVGLYYRQSVEVPKDKFKQLEIYQRRFSESLKRKTRIKK
eukprot:GHVP01006300.1.p1 GENE.GHVP01006300.1~~GHVP01006300.1.p1  ORF type:complete len:128 (+),score=25.52 GHVP01006300.1:608-991(+)